MVHRLLEDKALTDFESSIIINTYTETSAPLIISLKDIVIHLFPNAAPIKNKWAMRCYMQKPKNMPVTVYCDRLVELNKYSLLFPDADKHSPLGTN